MEIPTTEDLGLPPTPEDAVVTDAEDLQRKLEQLEQVDIEKIENGDVMDHYLRVDAILKFMAENHVNELVADHPLGSRIIAVAERAKVDMNRRRMDQIKATPVGCLMIPDVAEFSDPTHDLAVQFIEGMIEEYGSINFAQLALMFPAYFLQGKLGIGVPGFRNLIVWSGVSDDGAKVMETLLERGYTVASAPPEIYAIYAGMDHLQDLIGEAHPEPSNYDELRWFPGVVRKARGVPHGVTVQ